jgi:hypothetical protein
MWLGINHVIMANHMINKFNNGPLEFKNIRKYNMFF